MEEKARIKPEGIGSPAPSHRCYHRIRDGFGSLMDALAGGRLRICSVKGVPEKTAGAPKSSMLSDRRAGLVENY